jgi:hypothetical protein
MSPTKRLPARNKARNAQRPNRQWAGAKPDPNAKAQPREEWRKNATRAKAKTAKAKSEVNANGLASAQVAQQHTQQQQQQTTHWGVT